MKNSKVIKYCSGCGLCASNSNGGTDSRGFYRPNINTAFDSKYCYATIIDQAVNSNSIWGPFDKIYLGYSPNDEIRYKASSGGVLTEICRWMLETHQVDGILHIQEDKKNPLKTILKCSISVDDLFSGMGSRYTASAPLLNIFDYLGKGKKYVFVGKPCDVRILRNYIKLNQEYCNDIILFLSFFCAGTPSVQAHESLFNALGCRKEDVEHISYRGKGWPGMTQVHLKSGKILECEYETSWGKYLGRNLQEVCRFCWDSTGEAADISCGDAWFLENGKPIFNESKGRNLIFSRTDIGKRTLLEMSEANSLIIEGECKVSELEQIQYAQLNRKATMFSKILAMRCLNKEVPNYRLSTLFKYSKKVSCKRNLKIFIGTLERIVSKNI